jgi:hypothetical protein
MNRIFVPTQAIRWILLVVLIAGVSGVAAPPARAKGLVAPAVTVVSSDTAGVSLTVTLPPIDIQDFTALAAEPGWHMPAQAGAPAIPAHTLLLALPPGHHAVIRSIQPAQPQLSAQVQVAPVPTQVWDNEPLPGARPAAPEWREQASADPAIYAHDAWFPLRLAALGAESQLREQAFVPLTLTPIQWRPLSGELRQYAQISLRIDFVAAQPALPLRPDPLWSATYNAMFANRLPPSAAHTAPGARPPAQVVSTIQGVRLSLPAAGIYSLTLSQLSALGVPAAWINNPTYLHFWRGTTEIPRLISGNALIFYLPPYDTRQSDSAGVIVQYVYGQAGLVPPTRSVAGPAATMSAAYTATLHLEEQVFYFSHDPEGEGMDHWWWKYWYKSGNGQAPAPIQIPFTLDSAANSGQAASVKIRLHGGVAGTTHAVALALNGVSLGELEWVGRALYEATLAVPAATLSTTNTLTLTPLGSTLVREISYVDWVDIAYARSYTPVNQRLEFTGAGGSYAIPGFNGAPVDIWDITDPAQAQQVTGYVNDGGSLRWHDALPRRYLVQAQSARRPVAAPQWFDQPDLHSPFNGADYLAITYNPPGATSWSDALAPLLARRMAQGYRTSLIDVQWIYDQFGDGRVDPAAIRAFIAYAYQSWLVPAPSYVLLVGDGSDDPHDYENTLGHAATNFIPPYLAYVDPWIGETAADNRYVTVAGSDDIPDLHLGRFPASSLLDVQVMVGKTLAYEQTDPEAEWLKHVLLVADDADSAGDFRTLSDNLGSVLPAGIITTTQYYLPGADVAAFRANLVNNINAGQLFVNYIGHAGFDVWAEPSLYTINSINQLTNTLSLPIMLPMTCYVGHYQKNWATSLAENELRRSYTANNSLKYAGAVASWSPTGLGIAHGHDYLNRGFLDAVLNNGFRRLGPATLAGKLALAEQGNLAPDLLNTYLIFGDPALQIPLAFIPISAVNDSFSLGRNTPGTILDPLSNDINPYAGALVITSVGSPAHGTVTISADGAQLIYIPQRRYSGSDSFTYTASNPTNGSRSTAAVTLDILATGSNIYLPQVLR